MGKEDPQQIEASGSSVCSLSLYRAIEDYIKAQRVGPVVYQGLETPASGLSFPDEDRLSKRKSIGETISLQVEVESRNSPEKEEVSVLSVH